MSIVLHIRLRSLETSLETRSDVVGLSGAAMTSTPAVAPTSGKLKLLKMQLDELRQKEEEEREQNKDLEKLVKDLQRDLNQGCSSKDQCPQSHTLILYMLYSTSSATLNTFLYFISFKAPGFLELSTTFAKFG